MLKSYAKINLGLDIDLETFPYTEKHKLKSLFVLYKKLYDQIDIKVNDKTCDEITYLQNNKFIKYEDCLVQKTLNYLRQKKLINNFYTIQIIKNIPARSGLGGASSDASTILKHIYPSYQNLDMLDIALSLGSDIPFFLHNVDSAIVSNFGDVIDYVVIESKLNIQIHLNNYHFSTREVFEKFFSINHSHKQENNYLELINNLNKNEINFKINNDLFISAKSFNKDWNNLYEDLKNKHDFVIMSGSGGTIVSIDKTKRVRTRYAPSPTGYFHIGGARTAIFNYLFAKHNQGDFIVRIEDTDMDRNVENGIDSQLDNLEWMNVSPDESIRNPKQFGPYIQSEKIDHYFELGNELLKQGKAYYCFCDQEKLENDRKLALENHQTPKYNRHCLKLTKDEINNLIANNTPKVIRLKIDENKNYTWNDLIRGEISVPGSAMTDPVIIKSNGIAMYNFAVVVDDVEMEISHVLRGEEHISNTPYQLAIKEALGYDSNIQYGHLSVIIDESGKKLSKRNKEMKQFISDYKDMGFLPDAVVNFLGLLSWSHSENKEIISHDEFVKSFDITRLSKSPTFFDYKKMLWIGNEYFKKISNEEYLVFVKKFINIDLSSFLKDNIDILLLLFKNQISYADQLNDLIKEYFYRDNLIQLTNETKEIVNSNKDVVELFKEKISNITDWSIDNINQVINEVKEATKKSGKNLFMPIRISATNMEHGPELAKILYLTQQSIILGNIDKILK